MRFQITASDLKSQLNALIPGSRLQFEDLGNFNSVSIKIDFDQTIPWLRSGFVTCSLNQNEARIEVTVGNYKRKQVFNGEAKTEMGEWKPEFVTAIHKAVQTMEEIESELKASPAIVKCAEINAEITKLKDQLETEYSNVKSSIVSLLDSASL